MVAVNAFGKNRIINIYLDTGIPPCSNFARDSYSLRTISDVCSVHCTPPRLPFYCCKKNAQIEIDSKVSTQNCSTNILIF